MEEAFSEAVSLGATVIAVSPCRFGRSVKCINRIAEITKDLPNLPIVTIDGKMDKPSV